MRKVAFAVGLVAWVALVGGGCKSEPTPTSPSAMTGPSSGFAASSSSFGGAIDAQDVSFPPRDQPFDFRVQLEAKYRDGLRRAAGTSFVDIEGDIVWVQEYLRYRVNACDHVTAVQKVMDQIDGRGIQPVCGSSPTGSVLFPPRNEPFAFRTLLEAKYRDGLRRGPTTTHVDIEGDIVWIQEYIRYRVNNCGHIESVQKVFAQIDGAGVQPTCGVSLPSPPVARFTVTPNSGTTASAGQCEVVSVSAANQLRCRFDAGTSSGAITEYRWTFPGQVMRTGVTQQDISVPCGSFGGGGGATERGVSLTVSGPGGSDTRTTNVTFVKATFC